jgi:hypothetical protein
MSQPTKYALSSLANVFPQVIYSIPAALACLGDGLNNSDLKNQKVVMDLKKSIEDLKRFLDGHKEILEHAVLKKIDNVGPYVNAAAQAITSLAGNHPAVIGVIFVIKFITNVRGHVSITCIDILADVT